MNFHFKDMEGYEIQLTFEAKQFSARPNHVLVFPFYAGKIVMTKHKARGWELPGGKVEPGEALMEAAIRETWEETGAVLDSLLRVGEYTVKDFQGADVVKAIYVARVDHFEELPHGFETEGYRLFPFSLDTQGTEFSTYIKDDVFYRTRQFIINSGWLHHVISV